MTNVDVDQSGKTSNLAVDTVLAFSNDLNRAILVPAQVKRAIVQVLRARGKSGTRAAIQLFAAGLFLLLKDALNRVDQIVIDVEYTGYDADIRSMLLNWIWRVDPVFEKERLIFRHIGKNSPAHKLAIDVYRGRRDADGRVSEADLLAILLRK